jgi:uncharacterized membrane protein HdeD (DUF308 family)
MLRSTVMPALMVVVGIAALVSAAAQGVVMGVVIGVLLMAAGGLRLYAERGAR